MIEQSGVYTARKDEQHLLILVEGVLPCLKITKAADLNEFAKGNRYALSANSELIKYLNVNPMDWEYKRLDGSLVVSKEPTIQQIHAVPEGNYDKQELIRYYQTLVSMKKTIGEIKVAIRNFTKCEAFEIEQLLTELKNVVSR